MSNNIDPELQQIRNGLYGEDIRTAIHDALGKLWVLAESKEPESGGGTVHGAASTRINGVVSPSVHGIFEAFGHYGFKINKSSSDPTTAVTYTYDAVAMTPAGMDFSNQVFDYGGWRNVWFVKNAKPCALNFNGTVDYYLDPNDYTKKLDGTPSDIQYTLLSTEPSDWSTQWKQYYHIVSGEYVLLDSGSAPTFAANTYYKMTCTYTSGNFMTQFPKVWVKRYEDASYNYFEFADTKLDSDFQDDAFVDASGVHKECIYLPMFKGSIVDSKLRSIPGMIPERQTTAVEELTYAQNCGTGWQCWDFSTKELLTDLMVLISKNTDSQSKFGEGRSAGYDSTEETTNGLLQTGTLVKKGAFFGDGTAWPNSLKDMKVWHCESFYANRWERELGVIADGTGYKYKATPPYNFTGDGYATVSGADPTAVDGYVKTITTFAGGSVPKTGSDNYSDALFRDYYYPYRSGTCVMIRGGTCAGGTASGTRGGSMSNEASKRHWAIGASPVYK